MKHDRKRLHQVVAETLTRTCPGALDEKAALLVHHYSEAGDDSKTAEHAVRAGDVAARLFAYPEARVDYALAMDALARLPDSREYRTARVDTLIKQVSVSLRADGPETSLERLRQAETLLASLDYALANRARRAWIHYWMGHAYLLANQPGQAIQHMEQVLAAAQGLQDPELLAMPASVIGRALMTQGKFSRACEFLNRALEPLEQAESWQEWIIAKACQALSFAMQGNHAQAVQEGERALARATELQNWTGISQGYWFLGLIYWASNDAHKALQEFEQSNKAWVRIGNNWLQPAMVGLRVLVAMRSKDDSANQPDAVVLHENDLRTFRNLVLGLWFIAGYAEILVRQNDFAKARSLAEQVMESARARDDIFAMGMLERAQGSIAARLEPPRIAESDEHFCKSLQLFEEGDARLEAARTRVAWGKLLQECRDNDAAREHLEQAAAQFEQSGLTRELDTVRALLRATPGKA